LKVKLFKINFEKSIIEIRDMNRLDRCI